MQFFGGLANALGVLYQNAYQGITKLAGMSQRLEELTAELERRGGGDQPEGGDEESARML